MQHRGKLIGIIVVVALLLPARAPAYSVLTHQASVDTLWDGAIKPLLLSRYPKTSEAELNEARAYAYGGSVIHDLGYYPFGSRFFSNLLHYVRSGDFVEALIRNATDVNELAFALGAMGHYASDNNGHPLGTNRAIPLLYPKLREKFGSRVRYVDSPKQHILVEFSFDVVHVAAGVYAPEAFHRFIGFKVAMDVLERAFAETYALDMGDQFFDRSLAVGTYRYAVAKAIPQMTKVAWKKKRKEIEQLQPGITQAQFVFNLSRRQYEKEFGRDYARPRGFARVVGFLYHLIPKIGPFRALAFKVPTPEAEKLFLDSFVSTKERFAQLLSAARAGDVTLANTNLDIGVPAPRGEYELADETYDRLLEKLTARQFAGASDALHAELRRHFGANDARLARQ
jgi:Zinc dependent phospholipase C